jgi:hypothetical protein
MTDDLTPIRNALTERAGDFALYLIGEPTAASKRELRWGRHGSFSLALTGKKCRRLARSTMPATYLQPTLQPPPLTESR